MKLDVRIPMGWLFLLLGIILVIYGLTSGQAIYTEHSLGINENLRWGAVYAVFGACVLYLAYRRKA